MLADTIVTTTTHAGFNWAATFSTIGVMVVVILFIVMVVGFFYILFTVGEINDKVGEIYEIVDDDDDKETPKKEEEKK